MHSKYIKLIFDSSNKIKKKYCKQCNNKYTWKKIRRAQSYRCLVISIVSVNAYRLCCMQSFVSWQMTTSLNGFNAFPTNISCRFIKIALTTTIERDDEYNNVKSCYFSFTLKCSYRLNEKNRFFSTFHRRA